MNKHCTWTCHAVTKVWIIVDSSIVLMDWNDHEKQDQEGDDSSERETASAQDSVHTCQEGLRAIWSHSSCSLSVDSTPSDGKTCEHLKKTMICQKRREFNCSPHRAALLCDTNCPTIGQHRGLVEARHTSKNEMIYIWKLQLVWK